jgi:hypothetical protein
MKKLLNPLLILLLLSFQNSFGQTFEISEIFETSSVILNKLNENDYSQAEGSPYLDKNFKSGKLVFENSKTYNVLARLNVGSQKFEIKKDSNSEPNLIEIDNSVKVEMNGIIYKSHSINLNGQEIIAVLEDCIELENISLYYFPKKVIKMPVDTGGANAPSSGSSRAPKPKWADASEFVVKIEGRWNIIPKSYKKLVAKNIFDQKLLKKYKKANKLNLQKKESLIVLVSYFNSI